MNTCTLEKLTGLRDLVARAQGADEPVIVFDGEDECLVCMRPPVFERMLFDTGELALAGRASLRL